MLTVAHRSSSRAASLLALTTRVLLAVVAIPISAAAHQQLAIQGRVLDGQTGQPIEKARVSTAAAATSTDRDGRFTIAVAAAAATEVTVSSVGYGVARRTLSPGIDAEIHLTQDAAAYEERVVVRPALFDSDVDAPLAQTLQNVELRNLSGVVTDDVLRAVQTLPGVAAGDDFYGTFAVRGSGFQNTGLYIDGVLVNSPFHTIRDLNDAFSLSILNNDVIGGVTLVSSGAPARYGDRVGAVLSLDTRDGNRETTTVRANLGATGASLVAEGPLGTKGTSWLVGARKSFLDYVVRAIQENPSFVIGYADVQAKLSHRAGAHALSLFVLHGASDYEDSSPSLPRTDVARAAASSELVSARWVWSPSAATSLATAGFWSREAGTNRNEVAETLFDTTSTQRGGRLDVTRELGRSHLLEGGVLARRLSSRQEEAVVPRLGQAMTATTFDAATWESGAYLQDTWSSASGRIGLTAGARVDRSSVHRQIAVLPRGSGTLRLSARTRVSVATGAYAQFPSLDLLFGPAGNPTLVAEESNHITVGVDHRLSPTVRAQVQLYRDVQRHRIGQARLEPRLERGVPVVPGDGISRNAWAGTSRGVELMLQRRSPNGLTGWLSYALAHTELRDADTGLTFDGDYDQRHTVNAYVSYRLSHRTNVSAKFRFGSNMPVPGYYEGADGDIRLSSRRNQLRLPAYSRLDVRASRTFAIRRTRLTAYAEILNVLNHSNYRYTGRSIFLPSGRVTFSQDTQFPFLPAAGLTMEW